MSIWAVNWALQTCVANPTHKLVLVALANYADDNDWAWPRVDTLAELTSSSRRTVFRALNGLAQTGLIERLEGFEPEWNGSTRRVQSVWRLMIPDSVSRRSSGASRPSVVRRRADALRRDETPSDVHCDTDDTVELTRPNGEDTGRQVRDRIGVAATPRDETPSGVQCDTGDTVEPTRGNAPVEAVRGGCVTGVTGGVTPVTLPPTPPNKEEPLLEPSPPYPPLSASPVSASAATPEPDGTGQAESGDEAEAEPREASEPGPEVSGPDWGLVRACVPESMQCLDEVGAGRLTPVLAGLMAGGWSPRQVREHLEALPLPDHVHSMSGLVCARLGRLPAGHPPVAHDATPVPPVVTDAERAALVWRHDPDAVARHRVMLAQARAAMRAARTKDAS